MARIKEPVAKKKKAQAVTLPKCPTGIKGLDEITGGGLRGGGAQRWTGSRQ